MRGGHRCASAPCWAAGAISARWAGERWGGRAAYWSRPARRAPDRCRAAARPRRTRPCAFIDGSGRTRPRPSTAQESSSQRLCRSTTTTSSVRRLFSGVGLGSCSEAASCWLILDELVARRSRMPDPHYRCAGQVTTRRNLRPDRVPNLTRGRGKVRRRGLHHAQQALVLRRDRNGSCPGRGSGRSTLQIKVVPQALVATRLVAASSPHVAKKGIVALLRHMDPNRELHDKTRL